MKLFIRESGERFVPVGEDIPTYALAILRGRDLAGPGNFYIETKHIPSRNEQLGLPISKSKRQRKLDEL